MTRDDGAICAKTRPLDRRAKTRSAPTSDASTSIGPAPAGRAMAYNHGKCTGSCVGVNDAEALRQTPMSRSRSMKPMHHSCSGKCLTLLCVSSMTACLCTVAAS